MGSDGSIGENPMKSVILGCLSRFYCILSNGDWGGFMLFGSLIWFA